MCWYSISWPAVTGAIGYDLQIDNDNGFKHPEVARYFTGSTTTGANIDGYPFTDGTYYWRVRAKFADGTYGAWSAVQQFSYSMPRAATPSWVPLYRSFNNASTDHFYTTNAKERDTAATKGWKYEGIQCSVSKRYAPNMVPLFRLFFTNGVKSDHFYTINESEKNDAVSRLGYTYEGVAAFLYPPSYQAVEGTIPLYRLYNRSKVDHFYTTSKAERDNAVSAYGYVDENIIVGYVMPAESPVPLSGGRPSGFYGSSNTATGGFLYSQVDITFPASGPALQLTRTYNSRNTHKSIFGTGWSHSYDWRIYETEQFYIVQRGGGRLDFYDHATMLPLYGGVFNKLTPNGNTLTVTTPDKTRYIFSYLSASADDVKKGFFLKQVIDRYNNTLTLEYTSGRLAKITDPVGRYIAIAYDDGTGIAIVTDPQLNRSFKIQVNVSTNNLDWIADWKGNKTSFAYKKDGNGSYLHFLATITGPGPRLLLTNDYDGEGRLTKQTDALGFSTNYAYDEAGKTTVTDPLMSNRTYLHSDKYELREMTDPLTKKEILIYNNQHQIEEFTDRRGQKANLAYKVNTPALTNLAYPLADPAESIATQLAYARDDYPAFPTSLTNPLQQQTNFTYDPAGNLTNITDATNASVSREYNTSGRMTSQTNKNDKITRYYYEDAGKNLTRIEEPGGVVTGLAYDAAGRLTTRTNPKGYVTSYQYDANDNQTKIIDAGNNETKMEYDEYNNVIRVVDANGQATLYAYDTMNQLISKTDANGHGISYTYDQAGRRKTVTDENQNTTTFQYDNAGNLKNVITPGGTIQYDYDANGNVLKIIDARGKASENTYDSMNRLTKTKDALTREESYEYFKDGSVSRRVQASNTSTTYQYDNVGRLKSINYPNTTTVSFEYDNNGNLKKMTDISGMSLYAYNDHNRLQSVTDPYQNTVSYDYDLAGNRIKINYPGGKAVSYEYDSLDRLKKVSDWAGGVTSYSYDPVGNLLRVDNANGTKTIYAYDSANRLKSLSNQKAAGSVISGYLYTLDNVGNITDIAPTEPLKPVFQAGNETYGYDDVNQLTTGAGYTFTYDRNGNLISQTKTGTTRNFSYNYENMLTGISGDVSATYVYNGLGQRLAKTINGIQTRYILDVGASLPEVLAETDSAGNITAYYVYGLGLISRIAAGGTRQTYHFNHRGDAIALTDSSGAVTDAYAYDDFGQVLNSTGSTPNPFKYVGKYGVMDEGNGLLYMRARYYSYELGLFSSEDTLLDLTNTQGLNKYTYVTNNPVSNNDPSGLILNKILLKTVKYIDKQFIEETLRYFSKPITTREYINSGSRILRLEGTGKGGFIIKEFFSFKRLGSSVVEGLLTDYVLDLIENGKREDVPYPLLSLIPGVGVLLSAHNAGEYKDMYDCKGNDNNIDYCKWLKETGQLSTGASGSW
jgi:RHS repeat-associated protein